MAALNSIFKGNLVLLSQLTKYPLSATTRGTCCLIKSANEIWDLKLIELVMCTRGLTGVGNLIDLEKKPNIGWFKYENV